MKHVEHIEKYLGGLVKSDSFHSLIIQSPPGWAKSTTINHVMRAKLRLPYISAGSYSTPLAFYNLLCRYPKSIILLDDCAGLFSDLTAMAVLKACSWPQTGTGAREVQWGSTSEKVAAPKVDFQGKLILLTNVLPAGRDMEAFLSRSMFYPLAFSKTEIIKMLFEAAGQKKYFENEKRAKLVVKFLIESMNRRDHSKYNLRTLKMAYEFAGIDPQGWKESIERLLPSVTPKELVRKLDEAKEPVVEQIREFRKVTGLSRTCFFLYREELGLCDPLRQAAARRGLARNGCAGRASA